MTTPFARVLRLHDRRCYIYLRDNGDVQLVWRKLENGSPHEALVNLSQEAAQATCQLLIEAIKEHQRKETP